MPVMPELVMEVTGQGRADAARWGGVLSMAYAVMQFIMMPVVGSLSDRFGRRPIILLSLCAYSIDFLLMALAPSLAFLFIARILAGALRRPSRRRTPISPTYRRLKNARRISA